MFRRNRSGPSNLTRRVHTIYIPARRVGTSMPCNNALSWSSLPLRATDLAITRTSLTVSNLIYPESSFQSRHNRMLLQRRVNQRQICFGIKPLVHCYWIDRHHDFQRRGYMSIEKMAASRGSVLTPHHHMRMDYRLSLIERDVTTHSDHFILTLHADLLVHL